MNNFRNELNANEKFARSVVGTDTEANFTVHGISADEILRTEKIVKFNDSVDKMEAKLNEHMKAIEEQSEKLAQDLNGVDILPMGNYAIIRPFEHNPFQRMKMEASGIITDTGGLTPTYKSEETGEIMEEEELIKVGVVVDTGYKCEFLKPGDLVFYNAMMSAVNLPFYKLGLVVVNEQRIIAVVNDNLTARKETMINGN